MTGPLSAGALRCFRCGRTPDEIDEYAEAARDEGVSPQEYVRTEEGTFNPQTGRFACTACYIEIGMPAEPAPGRWRAP